MNKNFYETEMSFKGSQDKVIHFSNNTLKIFWIRMEESFTNEII